MRKMSRAMALCGMTAALSLVLMLLGSVLAVFTYACPMLVGMLLVLIREELGVKWSVTLWLAISLLAFMLVPEVEMTAVFLGIFGWYPSVKPALDRLPKFVGRFGKLALLNGAAVAVYAVLMHVMGMEDMPAGILGWVALFAAANLVFLCYDMVLTRMRRVMVPVLHHFLQRIP